MMVLSFKLKFSLLGFTFVKLFLGFPTFFLVILTRDFVDFDFFNNILFSLLDFLYNFPVEEFLLLFLKALKYLCVFFVVLLLILVLISFIIFSL